MEGYRGPYRLITSQVVSFSTGAATSAPFGSNIKAIRLTTTAACHVEIGKSPTATTSSHYLRGAIGAPFVDVRVNPGEIVSVINTSGTAAATLYVSELAY